MIKKSDTQYVQIPLPGVILFLLLLGATSFFSGISYIRIKSGNVGATKADVASNGLNFEAKKSDKPEFKFFVMSFCPYGNQAEDAIKPVAELLGDKVDIKPQYIFDKIDNLNEYCADRAGDPTQCSSYIQNGYFKTEAECKDAISKSLASCKDEKNYLKTQSGALYASLHGRQEANQDVREMCAWNQVSDKKIWWNFVDNVNKSCTAQNADTCWEEQAKKAGLDTAKINECFNKDAVSLIEKEIAETEGLNVSGSPTLFVNGAAFPPEGAYTQDGKGTLKIGKTVFTQAQYRTPNAVKEAICASFNGKAPKECQTELSSGNANDNQAAAAGGCN